MCIRDRLVYFPFSPGQRWLSSEVDVFISLSLPVSADWAAQWLILYKRTKEVRVRFPPKSFFRFFREREKKNTHNLKEKGPYRRKTRRWLGAWSTPEDVAWFFLCLVLFLQVVRFIQWYTPLPTLWSTCLFPFLSRKKAGKRLWWQSNPGCIWFVCNG